VGDEPKALSALDRVFLRNSKWPELADVLSRQITIVGPEDDKPRHLELKFRLGQLREQHLGDAAGAIEVYRDILDIDPGHAGARTRLEARLGDAEHKLAAAAILEPIYEQLGEWRPLVGVHEIQVAAAGGDQLRKVGLLLRIGELERGKLGDVEKAFGAYGRAFQEDPATESAKQQLVELAALADDGWARLTALFEAATGRADLPRSLAHELCSEVARNYEERLGKSDRAVAFYKKALELEPDDRDALAALEVIFARDEKYTDLLEVYRKKAEIAEAPDERLQILFRIASIHEEMLSQPTEAIRAYGDVLAQDADNLAALRALDRLYVGGQHWQDLGDNLTRQLTLCDDDRERVPLLNRLASLRETHLGEPAAAIETYRQVLELDPLNREATAALERLLGSAGGEHELTIATILEPIYKRSARGRSRSASTGSWRATPSIRRARSSSRGSPSSTRSAATTAPGVRHPRAQGRPAPRAHLAPTRAPGPGPGPVEGPGRAVRRRRQGVQRGGPQGRAAVQAGPHPRARAGRRQGRGGHLRAGAGGRAGLGRGRLRDPGDPRAQRRLAGAGRRAQEE
jgi:tetratricopeptide (TPR) repeat protein